MQNSVERLSRAPSSSADPAGVRPGGRGARRRPTGRGIAVGVLCAALLVASTACQEGDASPVFDTTFPDTSRVPFPVPSWLVTPEAAPPAPAATTARQTSRPKATTTTKKPAPPSPSTSR